MINKNGVFLKVIDFSILFPLVFLVYVLIMGKNNYHAYRIEQSRVYTIKVISLLYEYALLLSVTIDRT